MSYIRGIEPPSGQFRRVKLLFSYIIAGNVSTTDTDFLSVVFI